jgi:hypothetical protein
MRRTSILVLPLLKRDTEHSRRLTLDDNEIIDIDEIGIRARTLASGALPSTPNTTTLITDTSAQISRRYGCSEGNHCRS